MPIFSDEIDIFNSYVKDSKHYFNISTISELKELIELINKIHDNDLLKKTLIEKINFIIEKIKKI